MKAAKVLVVDDERLVRFTLLARLGEEGHELLEAATGEEALALCRREVMDLVLLDYKLPDTTGLEVLKELHSLDPDLPVILMTAYSDIDNAVSAMKLGAFHYVNKPFDLEEMALQVEKALETTKLRRELRALRQERSATWGFDRIIGKSAAVLQLRDLLARIASSPTTTVLFSGESGTGKDLAAKVLHFNSERATGPFMNITCSALADSLLESELFGHEAGAFTDARVRKLGLLELADGGTVFLDEIGETSPILQAKLLRFLEERAFRRVGGDEDVSVDVRVMAATNRDLAAEVAAGQFREDLYYRLKVMPVELPPLRARLDDLPLLVAHYIGEFNKEFHKSVSPPSEALLVSLATHDWPGNIRELKNAVERAMLLCDGEVLGPSDFTMLGAPRACGATFKLPVDGVDMEDLERDLVLQALEQASWSRTGAARLLGMNRDQIRYRIEKFGLTDPEPRPTTTRRRVPS